MEKPAGARPAAKEKIPTGELLPSNLGEVMASPVQFVEMPAVQPQLETRKPDSPAPLRIVTKTESRESESVTKPTVNSLLKPQIRPSPARPVLAGVVPESGPAFFAIPSPSRTQLSRLEPVPSLLPAPVAHSKPEVARPAAVSPMMLHALPVTSSPVRIQKERESRITINIGAIEIRTREPRPAPMAAPSPPRVIAPAGFEAHAALRSHAPWAI